MTYNFNPDLWYDNERRLLENRLKTGELTKKEYEKALADLDRRLEDMWNRLDGSFDIPDR